ncbi:aminotransferase [Frankia sp. CcI156]|uniref:sulfurtransferase TusA family protein n=1 Tax=Frankia TaxID=1854 RepID=UPI00031F1738|nr:MULTISPECIES: sulfurtransferase TusA family protein [Frankia]OFB42044.1 aminotransferase [Frankia sp. CgIM4]OHV52708.1 aminotransferase [Frankia sp. CgIS1]ONH24148.1 aminotransferase [Frankia sp. CcI156]ORT46604.1 aminotransferase [Frankia sp. KB5]ORT93295.1 aminotransferase [Frankia casuarinae]
MTEQPHTVDSRGRRCPLPIIDLARAFGGIPVTGTITLWADDPAAGADVVAWCRLRGQELVDVSPLPEGGEAFVIRRLV